MKNIIKNTINFFAIGGFIPTLASFYLLQGLPAVAVVVAYAVVMLAAIKIN